MATTRSTASTAALTTRSGLIRSSAPPSSRSGRKRATSAVDETVNKKQKAVQRDDDHQSDASNEGKGGGGQKAKKGRGKKGDEAPRDSNKKVKRGKNTSRRTTAQKMSKEAAVAESAPACLTRTEQALVDSGISVAPPKRTRTAPTTTAATTTAATTTARQRRSDAGARYEDESSETEESSEMEESEGSEGENKGENENEDESSKTETEEDETESKGGGGGAQTQHEQELGTIDEQEPNHSHEQEPNHSPEQDLNSTHVPTDTTDTTDAGRNCNDRTPACAPTAHSPEQDLNTTRTPTDATDAGRNHNDCTPTDATDASNDRMPAAGTPAAHSPQQDPNTTRMPTDTTHADRDLNNRTPAARTPNATQVSHQANQLHNNYEPTDAMQTRHEPIDDKASREPVNATQDSRKLNNEDIKMASPPGSPVQLQGASRISGGIFRGRAVGNVFNYADLKDLQSTALGPVKGKVHLFVSNNDPAMLLPSGTSPSMTFKQEVLSSLSPILKKMAQSYPPIKRLNHRIFVYEDGLWIIKGHYDSAINENDDIEWSVKNTEYSLNILL
ncbi:hypothetical protein DXG01_017230, partial [Tephrocybe rancida]